MKKCSGCGMDKSEESFNKRSAAKDGLQAYCRDCGALKKKKWDLENRDRAKVYARLWHASNPEKSAAMRARSYARNKATILESNAAWMKENPVKRREIANRYYHKNKARQSENRLSRYPLIKEDIAEKQRVRRRLFPDKLRASNAVRRARKKNAEGTYTGEDIAKLLELQRWKCAYCTTSIKDKYHVDHVTPLAKGGRNDRSNLQMLCPKCNCQKNAKDPIAFAQSMGLLV